MEWTLSTIRDKVRVVTGRLNTNQMADDTIDNYINNYYQYVLPVDIGLEELETWFYMTTVSGQGSYPLDSNMQTIKPPITIDGSEINVYTDAQYFFSLYPRDSEDSSTYGEPFSMLLYDREVYLRPIPDDAYELKGSVPKRPDPLTEDTDTPTDHLWGYLIVYGASIQLLIDYGETETAVELDSAYEAHKIKCVRQNLKNLFDQRATPRW